MKKLIIAIFLLIATSASAAQNYTANSTSYDVSHNTTYVNLTNGSMIPQSNGTVAYCNNCTQTPTCAVGGSGAVAVRINNTWQCGVGTTQTGTVSINPGSTGQIGGYASNGSIISPMTAITGVSTNGTINVQVYGAKGDGTTDNTNPIKAAIAALPATGGTLFFPSSASPYNFSSQLTLHKNVIVQCGGAPNSTILNYTGTTGAALVWSDPVLGANPSDYYMGGWKDCELSGPGKATSTIGIYVGGDPSGVITPSVNYGDFLTFWGGKVQGFGTGYQIGNNVWENRFYSTIFSADGTGYYIPNNVVQPGENMSMIGGAIQNTDNDVVCNNQNADITFTNVSFDGGGATIGPAIRSGNATGSQQGCGVTLQDDHFEYFGNSQPAPVFKEWGLGPFTNIRVHGGVIQYDDVGGITIPSIADITGGSGFGDGSVSFELSGMRISSGGAMTFTSSCKQKANHMCISGDDAAMDAMIGSYGYYQSGAQDNIGPSRQWGPILIPATTGNTDHYGLAIFDSPVFVNRLSIGYSSPGLPTCTSYPAFYFYDKTTGVSGGSCTAVSGLTSCPSGLGGQAQYVNAGDQIQVGTANPATGCTASTNFYVTLEYRP